MNFKSITASLKLVLLITGIIFLIQLFWPTNVMSNEIKDILDSINTDHSLHKRSTAGPKVQESSNSVVYEVTPTSLINAVRGGDIEMVNDLLMAGANVNSKDFEDNSALIVASQEGYIDIVNLLIEYGAEINAPNIIGNTALIEATRGGHDQIVKRLIENDADVNAMNDYGRTALIESSFVSILTLNLY